NSPTSTKSPTRSSVHDSCLRCAIAFPPQLIAPATSFSPVNTTFLFRRTLEINLPRAQDNHRRGRRFVLTVIHMCRLLFCARTILRELHHAIALLIETKMREPECVLYAVCRH